MNKDITILAKSRAVVKNLSFYLNVNHQVKILCTLHHRYRREREGKRHT